MESSSFAKDNSHFKLKQSPMFQATTMAQNFFNSNDNNDIYELSSPSKSQIIIKKQPSKRRRDHKKNEQIVNLLPFQQQQRANTLQALTLQDKLEEDIEKIEASNQKQQLAAQTAAQDRLRAILKKKRKQKTQKKLQAALIQRQEIQQMPNQQRQQPTQQQTDLAQPQLFFLETKLISPPIQKKEQKQKPSAHKVIEQSEYFDYQNQPELVNQIYTEINANTTLKMQIVRDRGGFNLFWPEFHLRFADKRHLISAKRTSSKPVSTFIISRSITDFQENSPSYLGKVKSNLRGDIYNIYGPGLNPSNAEEKKGVPRELLATLIYNSSFFYAGGPRKFSVFVKSPQVRYYKDFAEVKMYQQEVPLNYIYYNNRQKIRLIFNRKPLKNEQTSSFSLDFKGKAPVKSIKNFILEQQQNGQQILLLGKSSEDLFNLQISSHISPYVAFAVAIANFDNRLISQ